MSDDALFLAQLTRLVMYLGHVRWLLALVAVELAILIGVSIARLVQSS